MTDAPPSESLDFARRLVALAAERRAEDPVVLDVRDLVDYTDFFVLLTGRSLRQNQAIAEHLVRSLKADGRYAVSKAGVETGTWICLDFGDAVVHVFDPATRARYDLELLWADAPQPSPVAEQPTAPPEPAKRRKRTVRKAAVVDADAANAPDSARPPPDEPEAPPAKAPRRTAKASVGSKAGKPAKSGKPAKPGRPAKSAKPTKPKQGAKGPAKKPRRT